VNRCCETTLQAERTRVERAIRDVYKQSIGNVEIVTALEKLIIALNYDVSEFRGVLDEICKEELPWVNLAPSVPLLERDVDELPPMQVIRPDVFDRET
jgi:hypothetical protein